MLVITMSVSLEKVIFLMLPQTSYPRYLHDGNEYIYIIVYPEETFLDTPLMQAFHAVFVADTANANCDFYGISYCLALPRVVSKIYQCQLTLIIHPLSST